MWITISQGIRAKFSTKIARHSVRMQFTVHTPACVVCTTTIKQVAANLQCLYKLVEHVLSCFEVSTHGKHLNMAV